MQRKPSYPVANYNIKMPESFHGSPDAFPEDEGEQQHRRLQLINFGHTQWGFNNWSWSVTKQELDFVDFANGKYTAGVVAFVSITVKSFDIHRENIGYATSVAASKGSAIYKSRKCAVTNALRETLLSFGGVVAAELSDVLDPAEPPLIENNPNLHNVPKDRPKNLPAAPAKNACANAPTPVVVPPPPAVVPPPPVVVPPPPTVVPPPPAVVPPPLLAPPRAPPPRAPRPSNVLEEKPNPESSEEAEARAERKRRQRAAQEEFRLKQMLKVQTIKEEKPDAHRNSSGFDKLLLEIPTQDIQIDNTGASEDAGKRKSPAPEGSNKKRVLNRLDIV